MSITYNDREKVRELFKKHPFNFDHYINAEKLIDGLGIDTYPLSFFIDREGTIKAVSGYISTNEKGEIDESSALIMQKIL